MSKIAEVKVDDAVGFDAPSVKVAQAVVDAVEGLVYACTPEGEKPIEIDVQLINIIGSRGQFAELASALLDLPVIKNGTAVLVLPTSVLVRIAYEYARACVIEEIAEQFVATMEAPGDEKKH